MPTPTEHEMDLPFDQVLQRCDGSVESTRSQPPSVASDPAVVETVHVDGLELRVIRDRTGRRQRDPHGSCHVPWLSEVSTEEPTESDPPVFGMIEPALEARHRFDPGTSQRGTLKPHAMCQRCGNENGKTDAAQWRSPDDLDEDSRHRHHQQRNDRHHEAEFHEIPAGAQQVDASWTKRHR